MENSMKVPQKLKIKLSYIPASPLLNIHQRENKYVRETSAYSRLLKHYSQSISGNNLSVHQLMTE
jgi:hypothetical protein